VRLHNPFLWILVIGAATMFALGVVGSTLLGMIPERTDVVRPVATISLDLSAQVRELQTERARLNAAYEESAVRIGTLERELAARRQDDALASVVAPPSTVMFEAELQTARQRIAALNEAMENLRRERDAAQGTSVENVATVNQLRRNLADLVAQHDGLQRELAAETARLRELLDRRDREVALLRKSVEDSRSPVAVSGETSPAAGAQPADDARPVSEAAGIRGAGGNLNSGIAAYQAGDYREAFRIWEPLAKNGNARAQFHLGALYFEGRGVARDFSQARFWLSRAAENGSAPARSLLPVVESEQR